MMKNILINQIKESVETLGGKVSEKQLKRLQTSRYEDLIKESGYAVQALALHSQNELTRATEEAISKNRVKFNQEESKIFN